MSFERNTQKHILHEFGLFKAGMVFVDVVVWGYYAILLYRETGSLESLFVEYAVFLIAVFSGFVFMTFYLDRLGYLYAFRISMIMQALAMFLILINIQNLANVFVILAIIRGLGRGLYWPIEHSINLKEVSGQLRGEILGMVQSITQLLRVGLPILAGALISFTESYNYIFLLGITVLFLVSLYPFRYNKKTKSKIRSEEITKILKTKNINRFLILQILNGGFRSLMILSFLIVPYLIIGDEFGVGALLTFSGVLAFLIGMFESRKRYKTRRNIGVLAFLLYFFTTASFAIFWVIPALIVRQAFEAFTQSLGTSARDDMDFKIRETMLGDFKNESALEFNLIVETCYLIGRMIIFAIFIFLFNYFNDDLETLVKFTISIGSFMLFVCYLIFFKISKTVKVY